MAHPFGSLSVTVADSLRAERASILATWSETCAADEDLRAGETLPSPEIIVEELAAAVERPQPVSSTPDGAVQRIAALFNDYEPLVTVATRQLLHLEEAMLSLLPDGLAPDETLEVRTRAHTVLTWVTAHISVVRIRTIALDALRHPLTRLFSKVAFRQDLEAELERIRAGGAPSTIVAIDLDNFKRINDTQGHQGGDQVLLRYAAALAEGTGTGGTAYHLSGDEFALIVRDGDVNLIVEHAQAEAACSYGAVTINATSGDWTAQRVHDAADQELLRRKRAKKGMLSRLRLAICGMPRA
jgi:diguanylate cyclase (GGDEF)-like protein